MDNLFNVFNSSGKLLPMPGLYGIVSGGAEWCFTYISERSRMFGGIWAFQFEEDLPVGGSLMWLPVAWQAFIGWH